ncbi:MAG: hypothetical protein HOK60_11395 [Planctomycetes bacterium]|nr:hypothetical protein [Planctomycetota bacterium]MBT6542448.1 hypothetical protein [Planctomycetota bacterium]
MRTPLDSGCAWHWLLLLLAFASSGSVLAQPEPCAGAGVFAEVELLPGNYPASSVALGDLDGDGDLDAFFVCSLSCMTRVFFNQGGQQGQQAGTLVDSGQQITTCNIPRVSLGDLDGDGDLDAFISCGEDYPHRVHINQGGIQGGVEGFFSHGGEQELGNFQGRGNALGDVDGDGDLDAFVVHDYFEADRIYINQGNGQGGSAGQFVDSGQSLGSRRSSSVALADLDGDGDLDAFVTHFDGPDGIYLNQGGDQNGIEGLYLDSGQILQTSYSLDVALADLDGDGDIDAIPVRGGALMLSNQGGAQGGIEGEFISTALLPGSYTDRAVAIGDIDNDGDLDVIFASDSIYEILHVNQGGLQGGTIGTFVTDDQAILFNLFTHDIELGDLDQDGDLDVISVTSGAGLHRNLFIAPDCDGNGNPDPCDLQQDPSLDCDGNGELDSCELITGASDVNGNGILDVCEETLFVRGDVNSDGALDIADAISSLDYLFGAVALSCQDAADTNDDGRLDIADPIHLLGFLFSGDTAPAAPFPDCDTDPTDDLLECQSAGNCL